MKVGIDIIEIDRFKEENIDSFMKKYCSQNEIDYINKKKNRKETLAGIYSCKEAVLKAFKIGIGNGIGLKDVSIAHNNNIPFLEENEAILRLKKEFNICEIDVSISHSNKNAIAICIIQ